MRYRYLICNNCGHEDRIQVYSPEETRQREREGKPVYRIQCPKCGSPDVDLRG